MKHQPIKTAAPPQDIPFWPDYMRREIGDVKWCVAQRLTPHLRAKGHDLAISPARMKAMEARHAEEVRAAVRLQMIDILTEAREVAATHAEIADQLLALPGLRIETDDREWPGSQWEARREAMRAEHADQVAERVRRFGA